MKYGGFNPQARWDRDVPADSGQDGDLLNEKIDVFAWFRNGKLHPQLFSWKSKEYKIETVTYAWQERQGNAVISYFSVLTGPNLYQISFNNSTFGWRINKVIE